MGWWAAGEGVWGDEPADVLDDALDKIVAQFRTEWKRDPTYAELEYGVRFVVWDKLNVPDSLKAERVQRSDNDSPLG